MTGLRRWVVTFGLVAVACSPAADPVAGVTPPVTTEITTTTVTSTTTTTTTSTTTTTMPPQRHDVAGTVVDPDGIPVAGSRVHIGDVTRTTGADGSFAFTAMVAGPLTVTRPGWIAVTTDWAGEPTVDVIIEPRVVRAIRAAKNVAADDDAFAALVELTAHSVVNALVFDTKDESGMVLYATDVEVAHDIGSVTPLYDVTLRLEQAKAAGLYAITRIVTFEDAVWTAADPSVKLAGRWVDPRDEANWEYPLALAVEACELGFDEIQFDYVRFPAGRTAVTAQRSSPTSAEERVATIEAFLTEARRRLSPLGCAMSADVFAIVFSAPNDQGIGQRPEELSPQLDAISPMIYPSHYSDGWLGFDDPNDHPGAVTANALDDGAPRVTHPTQIRPWLQAFSYTANQVLAGIAEAEERGHGWMLWNATGTYSPDWLPTLDE